MRVTRRFCLLDSLIPLLNHGVIEKNLQFNGQPASERVVYAKGGGAFGFFEVIEDVSQFTKAAVFQPGTRTDTLIRFSPVTGEQGTPDTWRDPRGAAVKFYTTEGNYDLVGSNTPVFFIRDPSKFPDFLRSRKRRADNHRPDNDMQWDFWSLNPASAHQVTWLMGDRGIPLSWRTMNFYGSHTFLWVNAAAEKFWIKYHFKTDQGHAFLTQADADRIAGEDADLHLRDLRIMIKRGEHPSWTLYVQVMPYADAADYRFNPFDVTKVWPHGDHPLVKVGRLVLNRNPDNHFAQVGQAAFEPSNLVPGIYASPDKMLQGRLVSYPDAHRNRIGPNYRDLPVNRPIAEVPMRHHTTQDPLYPPANACGPHDVAISELDQEILRSADRLHAEDDDFGQPATLVRKVFSGEERDRFVSNVAMHLSHGVSKAVLDRSLEYWRNVDKSIGDRIAGKVGT